MVHKITGSMAKKKIAIGGDHAGPDLKEAIKNDPRFQDVEWMDMGTDGHDSVDYPDFAHPTAEAVANGQAELGILICGSGNGVAMTANKHQSIRAALCWNQEIAQLAREHNNANMIALPARFVTTEEALNMVDAFLHTPFEGGRHERRVNKIACS
jgi:ribose 5-phosphate isomerase B